MKIPHALVEARCHDCGPPDAAAMLPHPVVEV